MRGTRRNLVIAMVCLTAPVSLYAANKLKAAKPAPKLAVQRTATVVGEKFDATFLGANSKADPRRLKALWGKSRLVSSYLTSVDKSVLSLLKQSKIPDMAHNNWKQGWRPGQYADGFSASLWREIKPKGGYVRLNLLCNIYCNDGHVSTQVFPNLLIRKPARDLRFDWHIHTGNESLDQQIKEIAIREAKTF